MEATLVPIFICVILPIAIVWLVVRARKHEMDKKTEIMLKAIEAGAKYVDLEVEAPPMMGRKIRQACQEYGTMLIRSFHDFEGTPPEATLLSLLEKGRRFGGEVVKIVTTATCATTPPASIRAMIRE